MKKLVWVGVILSGCLLPNVEVDPSLAGGSDGAGGGSSAGSHAGGSSNKAGAQSNDAGTATNVDNGGAGADEPGGAPTSGTDAGGTPAVGGSDVGGTGGTAGTAGTAGMGGSGTLGEQQGAFTIFTVKGMLPTHITQGPDSNFWFTDNEAKQLGRITPKGVVTTIALPAPPDIAARKFGTIIAGPDAALWLTDDTYRQIVRVSLNGNATFFTPTPKLQQVDVLVNGPDGNLWGSSALDNKVFKLTTAGEFTYFSPTGADAEAGPSEMIADKFALYAGTRGAGHRQLARISTAGEFVFYDLPGADSLVNGIALGADNRIWYANINGNIGAMTAAGVMSTYTVNAGEAAYGPIAGPDNHMWFIDLPTSGTKKLIQAANDGKLTYVSLPPSIYPNELATGPDGLWIAAHDSARIARLNVFDL